MIKYFGLLVNTLAVAITLICAVRATSLLPWGSLIILGTLGLAILEALPAIEAKYRERRN